MPYNRDDYVFFWKPDGPNGWASQWYPSSFTAPIPLPSSEDASSETTTTTNATFPTAEHYMMVQKALLFSAPSTARQILSLTSTDPSTLGLVKSLGRTHIPLFSDPTWIAERERIVLEGNLLKFRQNPELRELLLATGEKHLVEASPRDRIWGVGFGEKKALQEKDRWGLNLLGKALEKTRDILRAEEAEAAARVEGQAVGEGQAQTGEGA